MLALPCYEQPKQSLGCGNVNTIREDVLYVRPIIEDMHWMGIYVEFIRFVKMLKYDRKC